MSGGDTCDLHCIYISTLIHTAASPERLLACAQEALGSFEVVVVTSMPQALVQTYGAPAQVWYNIRSPGEDDALLMDILWVNKTATRLPEVISCFCA